MPPASDQDNQPLDSTPGQVAPVDGAPVELHLTLPADWATPSVVRRHVREWLGTQRWPDSRVDELVLAISEAVSNSIEHGYGISTDDYGEHPDVVEVAGHFELDADRFSQAVCTIRDRGRWLVPNIEPSTRGHGIMMMRGCTDELVISHDDSGTTVLLRSRPTPPSVSGT